MKARIALPALLGCAVIAACGGGGGGANGGGGGNGPPNITASTLDGGVIGSPYSESVTASGGTGTRTFSISAGALPAGLSISAGGAITGAPAGPAGDSDFTVSVSDSAATPLTDTQALSITIVDPLLITTANLPDTSVGAAYNAAVVATGGTPPYTFGQNGALPSGIDITTDGMLTGVVAPDARTGTFDVQVTDSSSPALTVSQSYTMRVALAIATTALADASGGAPYSDALVAEGGLPPLAWSISAGSLPAGLSGPAAATGVISGTADAVCTAATSSLTIQVADSDTPTVTDTQAGIELTVNPQALDITTASLPNASIGAAYNQLILASGGVPPYSLALTGGSLPSQLALAANGRITGTPDTAETHAFQVTVTDACPNTATQNLSITVNAVALGRNDSIAMATALAGNGTYSASISPSGQPNTVFDPDEDYYRITTTATSTVTIDINAQVNGSPLDPVIEVVNVGGAALNQCGAPGFTSQCVSDDEVLGVQRDSFLQLRVNGAGTFYIHVVDWSGTARPDMLYDLVISGVN